MSLQGWVDNDVLKFAVPLSETYKSENYILHYYEGFDIAVAISICDEILNEVLMTEPIHIYLYIIDYPHDHSRLDRIGSNNGYMQRIGNSYSIVIYRKLFWPKVLIHELMHVLWMLNTLPITRECPRWDEAIIEAYAVRMAIQRHYINESEYKYYLAKSKDTILSVCGGDIDKLKKMQKTSVYEYIILSDQINKTLI